MRGLHTSRVEERDTHPPGGQGNFVLSVISKVRLGCGTSFHMLYYGCGGFLQFWGLITHKPGAVYLSLHAQA